MSDNKGSNSFLGVILGGLVAAAAVVFMLSGGEMGGKKTVHGDEDLPPVISTPARK